MDAETDPQRDLHDKLLLTLELMVAGFDIKQQALRRAHPNLSEQEIAERLLAWLADRPPDSPGRFVELPNDIP